MKRQTVAKRHQMALIAFFLLTFSIIASFAPLSSVSAQPVTPTASAQVAQTTNPLTFVAQAVNTEAPEVDRKDVNCSADQNFIFSTFLCTIVDGLFSALSSIYQNVVIPLLIVQVPANDETGNPTELYSIWNNFRVIGNVAFIGVFLLAIIGQSFSWFLTPYEIKKILPRLFIGAIAIQLSWFISTFVIDVFNILGAGVHGLMLAPLGDLSTNAVLDFRGVGGNAAAITALIGTVSGVIIAQTGAGALSGMLPILFGLLLGLLAAFATLLLRQTLIFLLLVTSPLAFVAWVLPNTSGIFSTWWSFFSKALMMYPIIIAFITGGQFFAAIINADAAANNGVSVIDGTLSIIALFAPYLLIPLTFRFAGGAIAAISGNMDELSKKLDQRIFGNERIPGSKRYNRKVNMERRKGNRKEQFIQNKAAWGTDSSGNVVNERRNRRGRQLARASTYFGANALERVGKERAEAYKRVKDLTQNGRDGILFALLSGNGTHPISGQKLDATDVAEAEKLYADGIFRNPGDVEAAINYSLTKGVPGDKLNDVRESFFANDRIPVSQRGKERMWDRAVNEQNIINKHPDQRYRDPASGAMTRDTRMQSEYLTELNSRFNSGQSAQFEVSAYKGADDVLTNAGNVRTQAQQRAQAATGSTDKWEQQLNPDEAELMRSSRLYYNTLGRREMGPEASNEHVRELRKPTGAHAWLREDMNLPPRPGDTP